MFLTSNIYYILYINNKKKYTILYIINKDVNKNAEY